MKKLDVTVEKADGTSHLETIDLARMTNLGMASRNLPREEELAEQLEQMQKAGVKPPDELPFVTPKPNYLITTDNSIQVNSTRTAGEAEFVMYPTENELYIAVGNDHKEYEIAPQMMHIANNTCPSVVSDEVWVFDEIADHWDEIQLKSWVERDGVLEPYQHAPMSAFMRPESIVDAVEDSITAPVSGTAIWSGTVGSGDVNLFPEVVSGDFYMIQLCDPVLDRRLVTHYTVHVNNWITDVKIKNRTPDS